MTTKTAEHYSYDELPYIGRSYQQTHPDQLAAVARLHGMTPAPVERCRVLELACCDGTNLLPMAYTLPQSTFLGVDFAAGPLVAGRQRAEALGLRNIRLEAQDLLDFPADAGEFDYIIAHGFYSWVPEAVREKIMAVCGAHLSPQGVVYLSFNAYPGYHVRELQRNLMLYHLAHVDAATPAEQANHALEAMNFVAASQPEDHPCRGMLSEAHDYYREEVEKSPTGLAWFCHDLLEAHNVPAYFHQVAAHAVRHGLQFLSDVHLRAPRAMGFPPDTVRILESMDSDPVAQDQYTDFILCAPFRQVTFCRADVRLDRTLGPARMKDLHVAGNITLAPAPIDDPNGASGIKGKEVETFICNSGKISVAHPAAKATLRRIGAAWPHGVSFADLEAGQAGHGTSQELADFLLRLSVGKMANFRAREIAWPLTPGDRPEASAEARSAAEAGSLVTTLYHGRVQLQPSLRFLLGLLDGTRDRAQLAAAMRRWIESGQAAQAGGGTSESGDEAPLSLQDLDTGLEGTLQTMCKLGLLVR